MPKGLRSYSVRERQMAAHLRMAKTAQETDTALASIAPRGLALEMAARYGKHLSLALTHEMLSNAGVYELWVQNEHCPDRAMTDITAYTVRTLTEPMGSRNAGYVLGLAGLLMRREDQWSAPVRAALTELLEYVNANPCDIAPNVMKAALEWGIGSDLDVARALASDHQNRLDVLAVAHPASGPQTWNVLTRKISITTQVLKSLARVPEVRQDPELRARVIAHAHRHMTYGGSAPAMAAPVLVSLAPGYTPEEFRTQFLHLATTFPSEAVRLLAAGSAERRSLVTPEDLIPVLQHADGAVRDAAIRAMGRLSTGETPVPKTRPRRA